MPEFSVSQVPEVVASTFQVAGLWWLPSAPRNAVGGLLRLGDREGSLEVAGQLVDHEERTPQCLLGRSTAGESFTIPVANLTSTGGAAGGQPNGVEVHSQRFSCYSVLRGAHFDGGDSQRYEVVTFTSPDLAQWINGRHGTYREVSETERAIEFKVPEPLQISLPSGRLSLVWDEKVSYGLDVVAHVDPTFAWEPTVPILLSEAESLIQQPLEFFLTLAAGEPIKLDRVRVGNAGPRGYPILATIMSPPRFGFPHAPDLRPWEYLIPFDRVEADLPTVLGRWIELCSAHRSALLQYFVGALSPHTFLEEMFLSTVRAAEIWHRGAGGGTAMAPSDFDALIATVRDAVNDDHWSFLRDRLVHANEPSLKTRLDAMIVAAGDPLSSLLQSFPRFTRRVVDTRNRFTHHGTQDDRPFSDVELFYAQKACAMLFGMTLLSEVGLREVVAEHLTRTSEWGWLTGDNPLVSRTT